MKELIDKLSSYNIFNYLFPGVLFVVIAHKITALNLFQENLLTGAFVYYFIGLIISRIGSLVIGPILKKMKIIRFIEYEDYVNGSKKDNKLDVLSEQNNMYRTFIATFLLLIFVKLYYVVIAKYKILSEMGIWLLLVSLTAIFLSSYRKQTKFITKRVNSLKKTSNE